MPINQVYSNDELINHLREASAVIDGPLTQEKYNNIGSHSVSTYQNRFGSWNDAKTEAGLKPVENGNYDKIGSAEKRRRLEIIKDLSACLSCGNNPSGVAMDFHHRNSDDKEMSVTKMHRRNKSWEDIANEMEKCCLVCANCHREITYGGRSI